MRLFAIIGTRRAGLENETLALTASAEEAPILRDAIASDLGFEDYARFLCRPGEYSEEQVVELVEEWGRTDALRGCNLAVEGEGWPHDWRAAYLRGFMSVAAS